MYEDHNVAQRKVSSFIAKSRLDRCGITLGCPFGPVSGPNHLSYPVILKAAMQKRSVKASLVTLNAVLSNTERAQKWEQALQFLPPSRT